MKYEYFFQLLNGILWCALGIWLFEVRLERSPELVLAIILFILILLANLLIELHYLVTGWMLFLAFCFISWLAGYSFFQEWAWIVTSFCGFCALGVED